MANSAIMPLKGEADSKGHSKAGVAFDNEQGDLQSTDNSAVAPTKTKFIISRCTQMVYNSIAQGANSRPKKKGM